jgi:hypothetical protein
MIMFKGMLRLPLNMAMFKGMLRVPLNMAIQYMKDAAGAPEHENC